MCEAGAISEQCSHFRIWRSQTLVLLKHRLAAGCQVHDDVDQIADHDRPLTASVIRLAVLYAFGESGRHECRCSICNEREIAHGRRVADHDRRAGRIERLSDNGGDDRSFTLSWPKRIEWSENYNWYAERPGECLRHHIRGYFGS